MEEDIQTLEANPGETHVDSAEGIQNDVGSVTTAPESLTLEELNALTKHNYSSMEQARKGIENLRKAVGQKEIPVADPTLVQKVESLERTLKDSSFYEQHPELKPHKDFLAKFGNPETAIKDPVVKKALDALSREESEQIKSSPKIAQVNTTYQTDLAKAKATGNWLDFLGKHKGFEVK